LIPNSVSVLKKHIPNLFTCLNLFSGCIAVVMISRNHLDKAAYLVFIAAVFDFMDGFAARILKAPSAIGKDLDSLADVVTFGLVPGAILFRLFHLSDQSTLFISESFLRYFQFFPFIVTIFSALRLAKFNNDTRQSESFIGLPVPANTLLVVSLPLILLHDNFHLTPLILNPYFIVILCVVLSYLMVAELPLFALKFKSFAWKKNEYQYIFLIISIALFAVFFYVALPLIIFLYLFLSLVRNISENYRKLKISKSTP
jgi:CDP-diacylglycerol--serine O-phosphatidyltransferase